MKIPGLFCVFPKPKKKHSENKRYHLFYKISDLEKVWLLDYTRGARWPFRAFCVDGLSQITSYWCNYIKLAEIGNRTDQKSVTDTRQTDRQTHGRTNIKFWGPSTQKALKGNYSFEYRGYNINSPPPLTEGELTYFREAGRNWLIGRNWPPKIDFFGTKIFACGAKKTAQKIFACGGLSALIERFYP